jgi:hypothetical protein
MVQVLMSIHTRINDILILFLGSNVILISRSNPFPLDEVGPASSILQQNSTLLRTQRLNESRQSIRF